MEETDGAGNNRSGRFRWLRRAGYACLAATAVGVYVILATKTEDDLRGPRSSRGIWFVGFTHHAVEAYINGDTTPDFIVHCWDHDRRDPRLRLCVVDGATFDILWTTRPLSEHNETIDVSWLPLGRRLVAVDLKNNVRVYDLGHGAEIDSFRLTDDPSVRPFAAICPWPEDPGRIWIETSENDLLINPRTHESTVRPRPRPCLAEDCALGPGKLHGECWAELALPEVEDLIVERAVFDGKTIVLAGQKNDLSTLAAFARSDAGQYLPSWRFARPSAAVPSGPVEPGHDLQIAARRIVESYFDRDSRWHVVALDASTGEVLWNVTVAKLVGFWLSASRVYVREERSFSVLDATNGRRLGGTGESP